MISFIQLYIILTPLIIILNIASCYKRKKKKKKENVCNFKNSQNKCSLYNNFFIMNIIDKLTLTQRVVVVTV